MPDEGPPLRIVVELAARGVSGNEVQTLLLASRLRDRGHEVAVVCRRGGEVERRASRTDLPCVDRRPTGDLDLAGALRFARWLRAWRADAVLLTSWKRVLVAGWGARRGGVARVVLRVGGVHPVPAGARGWKYRLGLSRYVDAFVSNSRAVSDHLPRIVPALRPEAVYEVPNGIELEPAEAAPLRAELPVGPGPMLVAVGELSRRKGYDVLLRALARLDDPEVHLAVAGDGAERDVLRALARDLGVEERVHWLGHRRDVAAVLAAADAYVSASRSEGMAVAMLEAMTVGRPVVATDVGGVRDALAPRAGRPAAGWIVPPEAPDALAAALAGVVTALRSGDAALEARVDEAAWRTKHWFSVEAMVDGVEAALRGAPRRREVVDAG